MIDADCAPTRGCHLYSLGVPLMAALAGTLLKRLLADGLIPTNPDLLSVAG